MVSETPTPTRDASLGFLAASVGARWLAGVPFAAAWSASVVAPVRRVIESDMPGTIAIGAIVVAAVAPAILYLRRHALDATLRWDDRTLTLLRGGRVATSIAWRDTIVRQGASSKLSAQQRVAQFVDAAGRSITVATGHVVGSSGPTGRRRIASVDLDAVLGAARAAGATFVPEQPTGDADERPSLALVAWLSVWLALSITTRDASIGPLATCAFAFACFGLLVDPARRLSAALSHPEGREVLVIDTEERGRVHARRLDGSRVLLDVTSASHPDAMLSARRGFVNAVLAIPDGGGATTYRATETPIAATFVETRDDRVLRFERLRASLVDVLGYGAFFATAVVALFLAA